jgi:1,4-dihydroxy-2-naphthoyl-CoA synthase
MVPLEWQRNSICAFVAGKTGYIRTFKKDSGKMILKTIIYEKQDGIGIVTLNRPDRKNALSNELIRELNLLIEEIKNDDEIGAVIIMVELGPDQTNLLISMH